MWKELYSSGIVKIKDCISKDRHFISHHIKYNSIQTLGNQKAISPSWIVETISEMWSGKRDLEWEKRVM